MAVPGPSLPPFSPLVSSPPSGMLSRPWYDTADDSTTVGFVVETTTQATAALDYTNTSNFPLALHSVSQSSQVTVLGRQAG